MRDEQPIWVTKDTTGGGLPVGWIILGVTALAAASAALYGLYRAAVWACTTTVDVPIILAAAMFPTVVGLAWWGTGRSLALRAVHRERQAPAAKPAPERLTVLQAIAGDLDELIGDRHRDAILTRLGDFYAEGRLNDHDFSDRHTAALNARTRADLIQALRDLPH